MVDILTGVPSIVAGAVHLRRVRRDVRLPARRLCSASLALVILMIPVIVRTTEEMLKLVPNELREASYALGVPKWKTIVQGRAADGVHRHRSPASMLGIARVAGETAPLLILVGYSRTPCNSNLFAGLQATLPTSRSGTSSAHANSGQRTA